MAEPELNNSVDHGTGDIRSDVIGNNTYLQDHLMHGRYSNETDVCVNMTNLPSNSCDPLNLEYEQSFTQYTVLVYGYVSPFLVFFTLLTNILVCLVLMKKHMRSATNALLLAMAASDMLTGVWSVPCFIFFYTLGHYHEWVPYSWCLPYFILYEYLPIIFHTASIWLTVALATQRYIYVCHSMKAKRWCTIPNAIKVVVCIYLLAFLSQVNRFLEVDFIPVEVYSVDDQNKTAMGCQMKYVTFVENHSAVYFQMYWWFRVIFIHLIPCSSLVILNALLIYTLKKAQRRRDQLLKQNRKSESRRLQESNCTTAMLVTVVGVFLLVEFPLAVLMILMIFENTFDVHLINENTVGEASLFINLVILLSYPINFFIYCGMSRQFRETFKRLFKPGSQPLDREHSQYISLATENGANVYETKDTGV